MSKDSSENKKKKKRFQIKDMVLIGVFAAMIAVITQIAIPLPSGVPVTLQTFGVSLAGYCLGRWKGTMTIIVYILRGLIGVPVFSGFGGGPAGLFGITGGFIWGFLPLVFACGYREVCKKKRISMLLGMLGLVLCHAFGLCQFIFIGKQPLWSAFLMVTLPFLVKDVICVSAAYGFSIPIQKLIIKNSNSV